MGSGQKPPLRRYRRANLAAVLGVLLPLALFAPLAVLVTRPTPPAWDESILRSLAPYYDGDSLVLAGKLIVKGLMVVGSALGVLIAVVALRRRERRAAAFWIGSVGGAVALDPVLKVIFQRPSLERNDYSFPSGNAMASVAAVLALALLLTPTRERAVVAVGGTVLVALNGAALVFLYWHYPSDVLGGWLVATAWVSALWLALRPLQIAWPSGQAPGTFSSAGST